LDSLKQFFRSKYFVVLAVLVGIDIITKVLATLTLPFEQDVFLIPGKLSLYLTYNTGPSDAAGTELLQNQPNPNLFAMLDVSVVLVLLIYMVLVRKANFKTVYKWIGGIILMIAALKLTQPVTRYFVYLEIPDKVVAVSSKIAGILLYGYFFCFAKNNSVKWSLIIVLSAGFGNLINYCYYPYAATDFVNVKGSYELIRLGIFNFADVAYYVGFICLAISLIVTLIGRVINALKAKPAME
jgi:lipoprotein signal peptidase